MQRLGLAFALLVSSSALAQDRQYRDLELADGRHIRAEVLATEPTGLRMRTPQGETLISFELLINILPITAAEYDDQTPVRVWIHSPSHEPQLAAIYRSIPNVQVATASDPGGLPPGLVVQLTNCGADFGCMAAATEGNPWMWLVTALPSNDDAEAALVLRGRASGGPPISRADLADTSARTLWTNAHQAIGLVPPRDVPKAVAATIDGAGGSSTDNKDKPPRGKSAVVPTVIGAVAGGALLGGGTFAFLVNKEQTEPFTDAGPLDSAAVNAALLGAGGALVGALVGNALGRAQRTTVGGSIGRGHGRVQLSGRF